MKTVIQSFAILFFVAAASCSVNGQTAYDYPIKPGSTEWKKFTSTYQMIEACQIPDGILKSMSTSDLLNVCLMYPLLNNYTASNSPNNGLTNIISQFNGLKEYLNRPDSHKVLLNYYSKESVVNIDKRKDKGRYTFDFCAVELLLSQQTLLNRFSREEQVSVLKLVMSKYNEKSKYSEYFGFYGKMTTAFVANKYAESIGKTTDQTNEKMTLFTKEMLLADLNVVDKILLDVSSYTNTIK